MKNYTDDGYAYIITLWSYHLREPLISLTYIDLSVWNWSSANTFIQEMTIILFGKLLYSNYVILIAIYSLVRATIIIVLL